MPGVSGEGVATSSPGVKRYAPLRWTEVFAVLGSLARQFTLGLITPKGPHPEAERNAQSLAAAWTLLIFNVSAG